MSKCGLISIGKGGKRYNNEYGTRSTLLSHTSHLSLPTCRGKQTRKHWQAHVIGVLLPCRVLRPTRSCRHVMDLCLSTPFNKCILLSPAPSLVVTQIRGHIVGSPAPFPLRYCKISVIEYNCGFVTTYNASLWHRHELWLCGMSTGRSCTVSCEEHAHTR